MSSSDRIKELIEDQRLTQRDFADRLNIKQSTVSTIINGGKASIDTVIAISETFNVSIDWLIFGRGSKYRQDDQNINQIALPSRETGYFKKDEVDVIMKEKDMTIEILRQSLTDCQSDKETYKNLYLQTQSS